MLYLWIDIRPLSLDICLLLTIENGSMKGRFDRGRSVVQLHRSCISWLVGLPYSRFSSCLACATAALPPSKKRKKEKKRKRFRYSVITES
jgi:hypothetical protein